jgi:hypothetical protein
LALALLSVLVMRTQSQIERPGAALQVHIDRTSRFDMELHDATHRFLAHAAMAAVVLAGTSGAYLAKCAAGINLLPGRAPLLHDLLYQLIP